MRTAHARRSTSLWSQHPDIADDGAEPSDHQFEAARIELGPWASDEQVTARAFELLDDELRIWNTMAADDEAESRLGDY